jgi:hypothetical protein
MVVKPTVIQVGSRPLHAECGSGATNRLISGVLAVFFLMASMVAIYEVTKIPRAFSGAAHTSESIQTIRAYYAALDAYMETGDAGDVSEILAPGAPAFVPEQGAMGEDSGLLTYLLAVRSTFPKLRYTVDSIDAGGDIAIASVRISGRGDASTAMRSASEISQEFFRVRGGRIVQHWTTAPSLALLHPLIRLSMRFKVNQPSHLAIAELSFPAGKDVPQPMDGPAIVIIQRGRLMLTGNGSSQILDLATGGTSVPGPNKSASVGPGQAISIPEARAFVRNSDSDVAHVLIATLAYDPHQIWDSLPGDLQVLPPATNDMSVMGWDRETVNGAMTVHPLAFDDRTIPSGRRELEIAWAVLGPGASLPFPADDEWALIHVISGPGGFLSPGEHGAGTLNLLTNVGDKPVVAFVIRLRAPH